MKVLFVGRATNQWPYHAKLIEYLLKKKFHVDLSYEPNWSQKGSVHIDIDALRRSNPTLNFSYKKIIKNWSVDNLVYFREFISFCAYLIEGDQSSFYESRQRNYSGPFAKIPRPLVSFFLMVFGLKALRLIEQVWTKKRLKRLETSQDLKSYDCVFVQNQTLRYSIDHDVIALCQTLMVPVFGLNFSWDSLYNKGLVFSKPDLFFCWNKGQKETLIKRHEFKSNQIRVTGSVFFERWLDLNTASISKNRDTILYGGSSQNIIKSEKDIVLRLDKLIKAFNYENNSNIKFIFKPHPSTNEQYSDDTELIKFTQFSTIANDGINSSGIETFKNVGCVLGVNTSLFLDAICLNIPVASTCLGHKTNDINRERTKHFNLLIKSKVIEIMDTEDALIHFFSTHMSRCAHHPIKIEEKIELGLNMHASKLIAGAIVDYPLGNKKPK